MWKSIRMMGILFIGMILLIVFLNAVVFSDEATMTMLPTPLAGKVIVLDPGHGGYDSGAVANDQTNEKIIALEIAEKTRGLLEQAGALVYMTRESDVDLVGDHDTNNKKGADIRERLRVIHEAEADLFLSIHLNALPSSKWRGAQTFYSNRFIKNKKIATILQDELIRNLENTTRSPLEINNVYLLKNAEIPGALVEVGFLSNEEEKELLKQSSYQKKIAGSIYKGVLRYVVEGDSVD